MGEHDRMMTPQNAIDQCRPACAKVPWIFLAPDIPRPVQERAALAFRRMIPGEILAVAMNPVPAGESDFDAAVATAEHFGLKANRQTVAFDIRDTAKLGQGDQPGEIVFPDGTRFTFLIPATGIALANVLAKLGKARAEADASAKATRHPLPPPIPPEKPVTPKMPPPPETRSPRESPFRIGPSPPSSPKREPAPKAPPKPAGRRFASLAEALDAPPEEVAEIVAPGAGIAAVPPGIGKLRALRMLDLSRNAIADLPSSVADLQSLAVADLAGNRLRFLPGPLCRCLALKHLDASDNAMEGLPAAAGSLPALEELDLSGNRLGSIPFSLSNAPKLRWLDLRGNPAIRESDSVIARLRQRGVEVLLGEE